MSAPLATADGTVNPIMEPAQAQAVLCAIQPAISEEAGVQRVILLVSPMLRKLLTSSVYLLTHTVQATTMEDRSGAQTSAAKRSLCGRYFSSSRPSWQPQASSASYCSQHATAEQSSGAGCFTSCRTADQLGRVRLQALSLPCQSSTWEHRLSTSRSSW